MLLYILYTILKVYMYIMFVYVLLSWTPLINSKFYNLLRIICEPYLGIFRGKLIAANMDWGALIGLILINLLVYFLGTMV